MKLFMNKILICLLLFSSINLPAETKATFNPDVELKIIGLVCPSCAIGIKNGFLKTKLIKQLKFDAKKQTCRIEFIFVQIHPDKMKKIVENAGYELTSVKYLKDKNPKRYNSP